MANFAGTAAIDACLDSNATFQAHIKGIRDLLLGGGNGLALDTNSNEIAWNTATLPGTGSFATGSAVFKCQDTMQTSFPLFLKARAGQGSTATRPQWEFTLGTGHDGAGTLTGKVTTSFTVISGATKGSGVKLDAYCCVMDGGAYLMFNNDAAASGANIGVVVERTLGVNGVATADGACLLAKNNNTSGHTHVISAVNPQPTSTSTISGAMWNAEVADIWSQVTDGSNVGTQPGQYWTAAKQWRTRIQTHRQGDLSPFTPITGGTWKGCSRWISLNGAANFGTSAPVLMPYQN